MVLKPSGNLGNLKGLENPQIDLGSPWGLEETLGRLWEPSWGLLHIGPLGPSGVIGDTQVSLELQKCNHGKGFYNIKF